MSLRTGNILQPWRHDAATRHLWRRSICPCLMICALLTHVVARVSCAAEENSAGEYELKAAILYNLVKFVEWPPSAYPGAHSPTVLCVLGWDPFGTSLTSLVSDKSIDGRTVQVRYLKNTDKARGCQILYISPSERRRVPQILSDLKASSVLTVGESGDFAARGGMVELSLYDKRVVMEINVDAASRGNVKISSRLLALARIVKDENEN